MRFFGRLLTVGFSTTALLGAPGAQASSFPLVSPLAANERALVPTTDISSHGVVGTYADVADGTQFILTNDPTLVRALAGNFSSSHTVGFSGAPSGNVTDVQIYYRASATSEDGTIQALLYDGDELLASGAQNHLDKHDGWQGFLDTISGLSASTANNLRVEIRMVNDHGASGSLRYSQLWIPR